MKFSFSLVLSGVFVAYILNSIYTLVQIYIPPSCGADELCLKSFLETKPQLQLILCTTKQKDLTSINQLQFVSQWAPLDYASEQPIIKNISIDIPRDTRQNGSLFLYAFVTELPRHQSEEWKQSIQKATTMTAFFSLTQYLVPAAKTFNLLGSGESTSESKEIPGDKKQNKEKAVTHITKKLRLGMMTSLHRLPRHELPAEMAYMIRILSSDTYLPPLKFDKFSSRLHDFYRLNSTDRNYELELEFSPATIGNLRMAAQFEVAMETMYQFGFSDKDLDEIKGIFSDTNVYLLGLTMFVASIHLLFDFLAFKNDVIYWKHRKSTEGLSSRTILWRCFSQIIIFFYLLEEKSSLLVIVPSGIGALIEVWKVKKAFKISFGFRGVVPFVKFGASTASEKATAQHDVESMRYLSFILYPLCIVGAIYSLMYTPHKSWYSWTIQSLVNGVYAFGFLFMLPQLFVNYKMKSVAHLPWRAFMYKAFNTFIDDLFAFIITMPTAHRVACFRDDVVFIVYLYQRWLYPVDKTRIDAGGAYEVEADEIIKERDQKIEEKKTK